MYTLEVFFRPLDAVNVVSLDQTEIFYIKHSENDDHLIGQIDEIMKSIKMQYGECHFICVDLIDDTLGKNEL